MIALDQHMTVDPRSLVPQPDDEPTGTNEELEAIRHEKNGGAPDVEDHGSTADTGTNRDLAERVTQEKERR